MNKKGKLFIISAPSGAGKTTLCNKLLEKYDDLFYSVSYTTREPRFDEKDGKDYFFISREKFNSMVSNDEFLEWAEVHGNYYGTSKKFINESLESGKNIILDIDPQGARQLRTKLSYGVYIFIIAPSIGDLKKRLIDRRTETMDKIELRIQNAKKEIAYFKEYDYIIINRDIGSSYRELESIYIAEHLRTYDVENIEDIFSMEE
ncbi:MAG: guanylate kinase [Calditerrivibrio sp.]|nr:guanylate kinase [Calditerrivibrio sp.]MCA1932851.1 guanylate kinase [Calditerrivibrio sp.]